MRKVKMLRFTVTLLLLISFFMGADVCFARRRKRTEAESLQASVKREVAIGKKVADEIAKNMELIENPLLTARVRGIFNKLTPWVSRPLPYNIHIVKEKSPNAFCVPGGNIYVTSGLLDFVRSDAELAFVIAHELAHADGKHVIIQMEKNQKLSLAALAVAIASRGAGAAILLSNVAAVAISNAYSRELEQEADLNGATIAEKAGYDLVAGVTVMESLAEEELKQPWVDPGIYLDHPKISERISYIAAVVEKKGYKLNRKYVLKLLIPSIIEENGNLVFKIDNTEIFRGTASSTLRDYLSQVKERIEHSFQMETSPYDVRITGKDKIQRGIYAGVISLFSAPVPPEIGNLEKIRERLLIALNSARKKHPMANYSM